MFDFLGKIPNEVVIACSGNKNSMAVAEFLSRTDRRVKLLHVEFKDEDTKDRTSFIKNAGKIYKMDVDIIKPSQPKKDNEYPDFYRGREIQSACNVYSPYYVIMATVLEDVVVSYILNSIKCNPRLLQYRNKNIIRPYINTLQDELDHWIKTKRVGYFEGTAKKIPSQLDFVKKHMIDNCYKLNPDLNEQVLAGVNEDFHKFLESRR